MIMELSQDLGWGRGRALFYCELPSSISRLMPIIPMAQHSMYGLCIRCAAVNLYSSPYAHYPYSSVFHVWFAHTLRRC
jgi:hypothetical protein